MNNEQEKDFNFKSRAAKYYIGHGIDIVALIHNINAKFYNNKQLINFVAANGFIICQNITDAYVQSLSFKRGIK